MTDASERIRWMVEELAIEPDDHLLEIGPGHGVAMSLVCELLTSGTITAIDRSPKMVAAARRRNHACIAAGTANILEGSLLDAAIGDRRFDTIFAMNIGAFWLRPEKELARIRELLAPGGTFWLLFQPPTPGKVQTLSDQAIRNLARGGFGVIRVRSKVIDSIPAVSIRSEPTPSAIGHDASNV